MITDEANEDESNGSKATDEEDIRRFPFWTNEPGQDPKFWGIHWQCNHCDKMSSISAEDIRHKDDCTLDDEWGYGNAVADRERTDGGDVIICPECETAFDGRTVSHIIRGLHEAVYRCPKKTCHNVIVAAPPQTESNDE